MHMFAKRRTFLLTMGILVTGCQYSSVFAVPSLMNEQQFWNIVGAVKDEAAFHLDARPAALERHLRGLEPQAIQSFQVRYEALLLEANHWNLWGAAYLRGSCKTSGWREFVLLMQGERGGMGGHFWHDEGSQAAHQSSLRFFV